MPLELSPARVIDQAEQTTGLNDWHGDEFRVALEILFDAIASEAGIDSALYPHIEAGQAFNLGNRLKIVADRKRFPGIAQEKIDKPLFILGLPRSGTTLLQALLTADPAARGTLHWELLNPSPPPETDSYSSDPRIAIAEQQVAGMDKSLLVRHPFAARLPEECGRLFDMTVMNQGTFGSYQVPGYLHWLLGQDYASAYPIHKMCLQHFQHRHKGDHWVCKSNKHLFTMAQLYATYPDLRLVWLHRDPAQTLASLGSFILSIRKQTRPDTDPKKLGREWASLQELALQRGLLYRERMGDQSGICDVHYNQLISDPLNTVAGIYKHFGMTFSDAARDAVAQWLRDNPQDKHGVHKYTGEQFGLDVNQVRERFGFYIDRFGVEPDH